MSNPTPPLRTKLGDILMRLNLVTREQVDAALQHQTRTGRLFGESLLDLGFVGEDDLGWALSSQLNLPFVSVEPEMADPETVGRFAGDFLRRNLVLPLVVAEKTLSVVLADPTDEATVARLRRMSGCHLDIAVGTPTAIRHALDVFFAADPEAAARPARPDSGIHTLASPSVGRLLERALVEQADLVHLDPEGDRVRVRFRIGTELREGGWLETQGLEELLESLNTWRGVPHEPFPGIRRWDDESQGEAEMPFHALAVRGKRGTSLTLIMQGGAGMDRVSAAFEEEWNSLPPLLAGRRGLVLGAAPRGSERDQLLGRILGQLSPAGRVTWVAAPEEIKIPKGAHRFPDSRDPAPLPALCALEGVDVVAGTLPALTGFETLVASAAESRLVIAVLPGSSSLELLARVLETGVSPALLASSLLAVVAQRVIADKDTPRAVSEILVVERPLRRALQNGGSMDGLRAAAQEQGLKEIAVRARALTGVAKTDAADLERHRYLEDAA